MKKENCNCKEISCKKDCTIKHTHKGFLCEKCEPVADAKLKNDNMTFHKTTFEDFLADKHADQYYGTDDMMPDDLVDWIDNLSVDELIEFADEFIKHFIDKRIIEEELEKMKKEINTADTSRGEKAIYNQALQDLKHTLLKDVNKLKS